MSRENADQLFNRMPLELLQYIFSYLDPENFNNLLQVSKLFNSAAYNSAKAELIYFADAYNINFTHEQLLAIRNPFLVLHRLKHIIPQERKQYLMNEVDFAYVCMYLDSPSLETLQNILQGANNDELLDHWKKAIKCRNDELAEKLLLLTNPAGEPLIVYEYITFLKQAMRSLCAKAVMHLIKLQDQQGDSIFRKEVEKYYENELALSSGDRLHTYIFSFGNPEVLKSFLEIPFVKKNLAKMFDQCSFEAGLASSGSIEFLELVLQLKNFWGTPYATLRGHTLCFAAHSNNTELVANLLERKDQKGNPILSVDNYVFDRAISRGTADTVRLLLDIYITACRPSLESLNNCINDYSKAKILLDLRVAYNDPMLQVNNKTFSLAVKCGNLKLVRLLATKLSTINLTREDFAAAIKTHNIELVQFLYELDAKSETESYETCYDDLALACETGNMNLVDLISSKILIKPILETKVRIYLKILNNAIVSANLNLVKKLLDKDFDFSECLSSSSYEASVTLVSAINSGNLNMLKFIFAYLCEVNNEMLERLDSSYLKHSIVVNNSQIFNFLFHAVDANKVRVFTISTADLESLVEGHLTAGYISGFKKYKTLLANDTPKFPRLYDYLLRQRYFTLANTFPNPSVAVAKRILTCFNETMQDSILLEQHSQTFFSYNSDLAKQIAGLKKSILCLVEENPYNLQLMQLVKEGGELACLIDFHTFSSSADEPTKTRIKINQIIADSKWQPYVERLKL